MQLIIIPVVAITFWLFGGKTLLWAVMFSSPVLLILIQCAITEYYERRVHK